MCRTSRGRKCKCDIFIPPPSNSSETRGSNLSAAKGREASAKGSTTSTRGESKQSAAKGESKQSAAKGGKQSAANGSTTSAAAMGSKQSQPSSANDSKRKSNRSNSHQPSSAKRGRRADEQRPNATKGPDPLPNPHLNPLDFMQAYDKFYAEIVRLAKKIPSGHANHKPISQILEETEMRNLIVRLLYLMSMATNDPNRSDLTLDSIIGMFSAVGVDLNQFRDDLEARFEKDNTNVFLKRMLVYTIRFKQCACACCGRKILIFTFGALGFESNHHPDDNATCDDEKTKWFDVSASNFARPLQDIIFELCTKTRLECWLCHSRFPPATDLVLPTVCHGDYSQFSKPRPLFEVQESEEGIAAYQCVERILNRDVTTQSFQDVAEALVRETFYTDHRDAVTFTEAMWTESGRQAREYHMKRTLLRAEKRLAGACIMCLLLFATLPAVALQGADGHHVVESKKKFNPSEGASKNIDDACLEHRKCFVLCKCCHMKITHNESARKEFMAKMKGAGYAVDMATGMVTYLGV